MFRGVQSFVAKHARIELQKLKEISNKMPRNKRVGLGGRQISGQQPAVVG